MFFFDANYANMILPHFKYSDLYKKRYSSDEICINNFSDEELDAMIKECEK